MMVAKTRIRSLLSTIYDSETATALIPQLDRILNNYRERISPRRPPGEVFSQKDVILITYGDQIQAPNQPPLQTLGDFLNAHLEGLISGVHILPFYPYSSDDGFAVIDYRLVDPALGDWQDINRLGEHFDLMFDAVINHISRQSAWFQAFQHGEKPFTDYFITVAPQTDLSMVVRPRALPLLTPVNTVDGQKYVWTTFSEDQIDLNYANPQVLLEIIDLLLFYVQQGASIIRLDAIAYLWKEIGTPSIHLPETHAVVKLFRAILDEIAPWVILITETNVPHAENISYFGDPLPESGERAIADRGDEAQMVYQFPLAPLILHTFHTGEASVLSGWVAGLKTPYPGATFFNFIASHDGIGVRPAEGLLTKNEIYAHGGEVSYKSDPDGSQSPYELNITLYDVLNNPNDPDDDTDIRRFLASQAIMLALAGVPGIYVHSLFGSRNCHSCVQATGRARSINREKFILANLEASLADQSGRTARIFNGYRRLLKHRRESSAFHPFGLQQVLPLGVHLFALLRASPDQKETVISLTSVIPDTQQVTIDLSMFAESPSVSWQDLLSGVIYNARGGQLTLSLPGYETIWLAAS